MLEFALIPSQNAQIVDRPLRKVAMLAASVLDKQSLADVLTRILEIEVELILVCCLDLTLSFRELRIKVRSFCVSSI